MTHKTKQYQVVWNSPIGTGGPITFLDNDATLLDLYMNFENNEGIAILPNGQEIGEQKIIRVFSLVDYLHGEDVTTNSINIDIAGNGRFDAAPHYYNSPFPGSGPALTGPNRLVLTSFFTEEPTVVFLRWSGRSWILEASTHGGLDSVGRPCYPVYIQNLF